MTKKLSEPTSGGVPAIASVEATTKAQFARVFVERDWTLFRKVAELNLRDAAQLRVKHMRADTSVGLLARNARKRLLIGVGVELLLKAAFLKNGSSINSPIDGKAGPKKPFRRDQYSGALDPGNTFKFDVLISNVADSIPAGVAYDADVLTQGLRIAKVFRNKEGHVVTPTHRYVPDSYRRIEAALRELYAACFDAVLDVQFAIAVHEVSRWRVNRRVRP
jgi:hypothetical protein